MMGEIAVPVTLTLLFEVNPLVLALAVAAGGVHEAPAAARPLSRGRRRRDRGAHRGPLRGGTVALRASGPGRQ